MCTREKGKHGVRSIRVHQALAIKKTTEYEQVKEAVFEIK